MSLSPLADITIVVTRPREQAAEFVSELKRLGANVFLFPTIEIVAPASYADLDAAIENLQTFDWIIFTSANAVEHFLNRFEAKNLEIADLDYLRVAALGEATGEKLRLARVHIDILPAESNAEALFAEIKNYVGELENLKFLFPRSEIAREILPQKLSDSGAIVEAPVAYRTILPQKPDTAKFKAMLAGGSIDCITFMSPSAFKNFLQLVGESDLPGDVAIACIGETTANAVREKGFKVDIVSKEATSAAFALAIADFFKL